MIVAIYRSQCTLTARTSIIFLLSTTSYIYSIKAVTLDVGSLVYFGRLSSRQSVKGDLGKTSTTRCLAGNTFSTSSLQYFIPPSREQFLDVLCFQTHSHDFELVRGDSNQFYIGIRLVCQTDISKASPCRHWGTKCLVHIGRLLIFPFFLKFPHFGQFAQKSHIIILCPTFHQYRKAGGERARSRTCFGGAAQPGLGLPLLPRSQAARGIAFLRFVPSELGPRPRR